MLYLYDRALAKDLEDSFNPNHVSNPVVKVIAPEAVIDLTAQIKEDQITFPIVALTRNPDTSIDTDLTNFTRMHRGVEIVIDPKTNNIYNEKLVPVKLSYVATLLTTSTASMDELIREFIFKYISQYFLSITLPYESKRKLRFGVIVDYENIERSSGSAEYLSKGTIYQSTVPLICQGAIEVSYTPIHLKRLDIDIDVNATRKSQ